MRRRILSILGVLAFAAAFTFTSCGSTAVTSYATLTVTVKDSYGNAVVGAAVATSVSSATEIKSAREVSAITATTDAKGVAVLENLLAGTYTLYVDSPIVDGAATHLCYSGSVSISQNTLYANSFYNAASSVTLPKLGGSYTTGQILLGSADSQVPEVPAAADAVTFYLAGSGLRYATVASGAITGYTDHVSATTSDLGVASFSNLPLLNGYYTSGTYVMYVVVDETGYKAGKYWVNYSDFMLGSAELGNTIVATDAVYAGSLDTSLALLSTNTKNTAGNTQILAPGSDITLTFNKALSTSTYNSITLTSGGSTIPAAVSISGATVTLNPTLDLDYNTSYTVTYVVTDGTTNLSSSFAFKTIVSETTPTAAVIALNTESETTDIGKYESGKTSFNVKYNYTADYTYAAFSKYSTEASWVAATLSTTSTMGSTVRATVTSAKPIVSGKTLQIKIVSTYKGVTVDSNILEITDQIGALADAGVTLSHHPAVATSTTDAVDGLWTIQVGDDTWNQYDLVGEISVTSKDNSAVTIDWEYSTTGNTAYGYVRIPSSNTAAYGTVTISAKDKAGNKLNFGTVATPVYTATVTLN